MQIENRNDEEPPLYDQVAYLNDQQPPLLLENLRA